MPSRNLHPLLVKRIRVITTEHDKSYDRWRKCLGEQRQKTFESARDIWGDFLEEVSIKVGLGFGRQ